MKYKFFTRSEKAWQAMLEDIKVAKKSIYLESFILSESPATKDFFEILKKKSRQGVKVKIIIDKFADLWYGSINKEEFQKAGVEIVLFNRWWFHRTHRKVLIVDDEIAFLGGVNVRGEYAKWLDLHVRLTGPLIVRSLIRSFGRVYELAGGKDKEILNLRKLKNLFKARVALHRAKFWLIERWPIKGKSEFKKYYIRKCREAKNKIVIATPYFIPHRWLISELKAAKKRGVNIEVIIPEESDIWIADLARHVFTKNLQDTITFFFIPEMNHAKVLLVDDREGLIGSNNIDAQSFDFNLETSLVFQRKDMVGDLKQILERWKKMAVPFHNADHYQKWYHRLIGFFLKILQPIL